MLQYRKIVLISPSKQGTSLYNFDNFVDAIIDALSFRFIRRADVVKLNMNGLHMAAQTDADFAECYRSLFRPHNNRQALFSPNEVLFGVVIGPDGKHGLQLKVIEGKGFINVHDLSHAIKRVEIPKFGKNIYSSLAIAEIASKFADIIGNSLPKYSIVKPANAHKYAGFGTISPLQPVFPWQSHLISPRDKSITQKLPPKKKSEEYAKNLLASKPLSPAPSELMETNDFRTKLRPFDNETEHNIILIGDSHAEYGHEYGKLGWVNALRRTLEGRRIQSSLRTIDKSINHFWNRGASGYNTRMTLARVLPVIENEIEHKLFENKDDLKPINTKVIFMLGSIDSYVKGTIKENLRIESSEFRSNFEKLLDSVSKSIVNAYLKKALLLGAGTKANELKHSLEFICISPFAPNERLMKRNWMNTYDAESYNAAEYQFRTVENTRLYSEILRKLAEEFKMRMQKTAAHINKTMNSPKENVKISVKFVDAFSFSSVQLTEHDYANDGLHMNASGHRKFFYFLWNFLN